MRHLILAGFLSLFFTPVTASPVLEPAPVFGTVAASAVNLRQDASVRAEVVTVLPQGTEVRVHKFGTSWSLVSSLYQGRYLRGWIWADFIRSDYESDWRGLLVYASYGLGGTSFGADSVEAARKDIVKQSRDNYKKPCGCPDHQDALGRSCRGKSAWEKENGASPLCFPTDVSLTDLDGYFAQSSLEQ